MLRELVAISQILTTIEGWRGISLSVTVCMWSMLINPGAKEFSLVVSNSVSLLDLVVEDGTPWWQ